jgi:hypothetical protein
MGIPAPTSQEIPGKLGMGEITAAGIRTVASSESLDTVSRHVKLHVLVQFPPNNRFSPLTKLPYHPLPTCQLREHDIAGTHGEGGLEEWGT